jgi:peptidoglycan/LPS O-acetylase OafA/YrhL
MVPDLTRMPLVNGVYWTLIIEIKFYVLIALQYRLLGDRMRLAVPAAIMACNFIFWIATGRGSTLLTYLPVFYIGIEIYCAEKDGWTRASCTRVALLVLLIAGSFDLFVSEQPVANIVFTLLDATVFIAVLTRGWELGMLSFFGRISYSLYLFHTTVGYPIVRGLPPSTYSPLLAAVLAVASSIVVAYVMFRCVETPGVQAGRGIEAYRMTGSSLRLPSGG